MFTGYELTTSARNNLLKIFPPSFQNVIANHITFKYGVRKDEEPPPMPEKCQVVGYIKENGVEGLLVAINGSTIRPDSSKFHITWSLDAGHKPVETNNYVNNAIAIDPIDIIVNPKNFWK